LNRSCGKDNAEAKAPEKSEGENINESSTQVKNKKIEYANTDEFQNIDNSDNSTNKLIDSNNSNIINKNSVKIL
jgi:hypothetical protein